MNFRLLFFLCLAYGSSVGRSLPAVTHYELSLDFQLSQKKFSCRARMIVENTTTETISELPFVLYHSLHVESAVYHISNRKISFKQNVTAFTDDSTFRYNKVSLQLPVPLLPGDKTTIIIKYSGSINGYTEIMAYVKDRVDENYALLRPDAFAYPILAERSYEDVMRATDLLFTYRVIATVPDGYTAACGGELKSVEKNTFTFVSPIKTWRIDVAVARFTTLTDVAHNISVQFLPGDSLGARTSLKASIDAIRYFQNHFGAPPKFNGYKIIEIPAQWGSQASDYYILQTADAFKDSTRLTEVYHEVGHTWNAKASPDVTRGRYFDEAFASFYQALVLRDTKDRKAFHTEMQKFRDRFNRSVKKNDACRTTPIAQYASADLGSLSYTKGAWSLYVLWMVVGENKFDNIVKQLLIKHATEPVDFNSFKQLCEHVTGKNLDLFFQEWIEGAASSELLINNTDISAIVSRYQGAR